MASRKQKPATNLLDCVPLPRVDHEINDANQVVLLRPRFMKGLFARWIQPRLRRPHVRITLDKIGSFVWKRCDGQTTVGDILAEMDARLTERDAAAADEEALDCALRNAPAAHATDANAADTADATDATEATDGRAPLENSGERLRFFLHHLERNGLLALKRPPR